MHERASVGGAAYENRRSVSRGPQHCPKGVSELCLKLPMHCHVTAQAGAYQLLYILRQPDGLLECWQEAECSQAHVWHGIRQQLHDSLQVTMQTRDLRQHRGDITADFALSSHRDLGQQRPPGLHHDMSSWLRAK